MKKKLRIGILGAGMAGVSQGKALAKLKDVEIVGVYNRSPEKGQELASKLGSRFFPTVKGVLDAGVDAVTVCTAHGIHEENAIAAARAGVHIMMEKPLTNSLASAQRIATAVRKSKVKFMMGMTHRFYPELREARKLVADGAIGDIFMAIDRMIFSTIEDNGFLPWVFQKKISGGGVFLENGIHGIDRLRWFIGSEPAEVSACVGTHTMKVDTEDNGMAMVKFRNGAVATMIQSVLPGDHLTCDLELYGTKGYIKIETWRGMSMSIRGKNYRRQFRCEMMNLWDGIDEGMNVQCSDFVRYVRGEIPNPCTLDDGLADLKLIMAIYDANKKGGKVSLR